MMSSNVKKIFNLLLLKRQDKIRIEETWILEMGIFFTKNDKKNLNF